MPIKYCSSLHSMVSVPAQSPLLLLIRGRQCSQCSQCSRPIHHFSNCGNLFVSPRDYDEGWVLIVYKIWREVARMSLAWTTGSGIHRHDGWMIHQPTRTSRRWIMDPIEPPSWSVHTPPCLFSQAPVEGDCWAINQNFNIRNKIKNILLEFF